MAVHARANGFYKFNGLDVVAFANPVATSQNCVASTEGDLEQGTSAPRHDRADHQLRRSQIHEQRPAYVAREFIHSCVCVYGLDGRFVNALYFLTRFAAFCMPNVRQSW